jgi:alanyl-tRNA synthetase
VKGQLNGDGVIVLGTAPEGRVALVVSVAPSIVERGVKAGDVVKQAAQVVGAEAGASRHGPGRRQGPVEARRRLDRARAVVESALSA